LLDEQDGEAFLVELFRASMQRSIILGIKPSDSSSTSRSLGSDISARPIASICCSPPDSEAANW